MIVCSGLDMGKILLGGDGDGDGKERSTLCEMGKGSSRPKRVSTQDHINHEIHTNLYL